MLKLFSFFIFLLLLFLCQYLSVLCFLCFLVLWAALPEIKLIIGWLIDVDDDDDDDDVDDVFYLGKKINRVACGSAHSVSWSTNKHSTSGRLPMQIPLEYNQLQVLSPSRF